LEKVFLSHVLEDECTDWARSQLSDFYNNPKNNYKIHTSHEVLGEVLGTLFETINRDKHTEAINDFYRYYDPSSYTLCTRKTEEFHKELGRILNLDPRIDHTDAKVLAHASLDCDAIYTTETSWSERLPIEVRNHL